MPTPTPRPDRFQQVWSRTTKADRIVLLGHDRDELSATDRTRLARKLTGLGKQARRGRPRAA